MPKIISEYQKARAKELFEQEGWSLAEIAEELERPYSTVKTWRQKGKWIKGDKSKGTIKPTKHDRLKGHNPKSDENLKPPFKPGNQAAVKHGLYSKYLAPGSAEVYDGLSDDEDELVWLREAIKIKFANYINGQKYIDFTSEKGVQAEARAAQTLSSMIKEYKILRSKIGSVEEDDGFIEALERSADMLWSEDE